MSTEEKVIENSILAYLSHRHDFFVWKNQNVGIWDNDRKIYRKSYSAFQFPGVADIIGIHSPTGKLLAIEVKNEKEYIYIKKHYIKFNDPDFLKTNTKKKQAILNQINFIEEIKAYSGIAFFSDGINTTRRELESIIGVPSYV